MKDKTFDYIVLSEILEHIQEPEKIMRIIKNRFNKNVIITIPNSGFILHRLRLLFGKFPVVVIVYHVKEHIRFWTHSDFRYWCKHLGYKVISCQSSGGINGLKFDLSKISLSLFAYGLLYQITRTDN